MTRKERRLFVRATIVMLARDKTEHLIYSNSNWYSFFRDSKYTSRINMLRLGNDIRGWYRLPC